MNHTPGPWRWEYNPATKRLQLCGGAVRYDLKLLDFVRSGMQGAIARFRDPAHPDLNVMKLVEKWAVPEPGREHHADWFRLIDHPDANLIAAAPDLLAACQMWDEGFSDGEQFTPEQLIEWMNRNRRAARAAIAKALGETE